MILLTLCLHFNSLLIVIVVGAAEKHLKASESNLFVQQLYPKHLNTTILFTFHWEICIIVESSTEPHPLLSTLLWAP